MLRLRHACAVARCFTGVPAPALAFRGAASAGGGDLPFTADDVDGERLKHSYWDFGAPFGALGFSMLAECDEFGGGDTAAHAAAGDQELLREEYVSPTSSR